MIERTSAFAKGCRCSAICNPWSLVRLPRQNVHHQSLLLCEGIGSLHLSCESKKLLISTNICGEKLKYFGYQFKWSFEEALED